MTRHQIRLASDMTAASADRYALYIQAVQNPTAVVAFVDGLYRHRHGRPPTSLREDFCGTAVNCVEWLLADPGSTAIGVDIDPEPLQWCRDHLLPEITSGQRFRLELVEADVRSVTSGPADVVLGLNSSVCALKQRSELLAYLRRCRESLTSGGMLVLEVYAGPEAQMVGCDHHEHHGFTAIWEQESFNAVTHETIAHLHFTFPDKSRLDGAFTYDYRLWSPPELVDALAEAEFCDVGVFNADDNTRTHPEPTQPRRSAQVPDHWSVRIVGWV